MKLKQVKERHYHARFACLESETKNNLNTEHESEAPELLRGGMCSYSEQ